ncbi:MAG: hypothetical protein CMM59_20890 [Rhodospirillaceae bacterium]|nr:hypothetical protein [Rhodospirillaceae bacterium]
MRHVYDLSRLRVLLVEDSDNLRRTLQIMLEALGVGDVVTARNGLEAIEKLSTDSQYNKTRCRNVDIILSDYMMDTLDGLKLLSWVRESSDSPNRFMPMILMSGAAENDIVSQARDNGVNEFIAKPFTAGTIKSRILAVINRPRQFVATTSYFGPDRQRKQVLEKVADRRRSAEERHGKVIYSFDRVIRPQIEGEVYFYRMRNRLKELAAGLNAYGTGDLPEDVLDEANSILNAGAEDFKDMAYDYLQEMSELCEEALSLDEKDRAETFEALHNLAQELRGQGGTFGYPLITDIGRTLFEVIGTNCPRTDTTIAIFQAHIDTMKAVMRQELRNDGGTLGRDLLASLDKAIAKKLKPVTLGGRMENSDKAIEAAAVA